MSARQKIKVSDIKSLICLVEARPAIYNSNLKEHNDKKYIEDCWKSIGERLKCKPSECRIKWTVLRNSYSRSLRRQSLTCSNKTWYLADSMSFLKDYMRLVEKDASFNEKISPFSDYENQSMQSNESNETASERLREPMQDESTISNESPKKFNTKYSSNLSNQGEYCFETDPLVNQDDNIVESKPCIDIEPFTSEIPLGQHIYTNDEHTNLSHDNSLVDNKTYQLGGRHESQSESSAVCDEDADMLFLRSMHKDLRKLSKSRKRRFKIEMMTTLYNHLDDDEKTPAVIPKLSSDSQ